MGRGPTVCNRGRDLGKSLSATFFTCEGVSGGIARLTSTPQAITLYSAALAARGRLAVAELGARWGTWGLRAAAAARAYNPSVSGVDLFFAESNLEACRAIEEV